MGDLAIRVDSLGKQYRIGKRQATYKTLRDTLTDLFRAPFRRRSLGDQLPSNACEDREMFWALKEVSFEIHRGEVVGIIGRNGAGKSTLLKILSMITEPTEGSVWVQGRIGSLLEVGTGFHPELTGRENVHLNGAILGMTRREIERKFDEIIAFAEIENFIDTPVKHYSSGMYLRLAFAVAAHLEPEILIVDEVLAVGDANFQKKCLGKMQDVAESGRTVLFVSHDLHAISNLTTCAMVLDRGCLMFHGETCSALGYYRKLCNNNTDSAYCDETKTGGVIQARVLTSEPHDIHVWGKALQFEFEITFRKQPVTPAFSVQVVDQEMRSIMHLWFTGTEHHWPPDARVKLRCVIPKARLFMGQYTLTTHLGDCASAKVHYETLESICPFEVVMDGVKREYKFQRGECTFLEDAEWSFT